MVLEQATSHEINQAKKHVLVVDDNELNRDVLKRRLLHQGHTVTLAQDGLIALEKLKHVIYDLVLLDIMMPNLNGYDVLERIKSDPKLSHIPVIMITAVDDIESTVKCIEFGADDYLTKPFNPVVLKARVNASLNKKALHDTEQEYKEYLHIHNKLLEHKVTQQVKEISSAQLSAIFSMSKLAESKDPETGAHLERMREYCRVLSNYLSGTRVYTGIIDNNFVETIYAASPLHDIGKVGVPDSVLLKPGKLDENEWTIMQSHTTIGAETLIAVHELHPNNDFIHMGIDVAQSHHEKWDGTGYPNGLSGTNIPLAARILPVGDVYDALTSKRCYKEAFSHDKSKQIILEGSGNHFEPAIVDAFLETEAEFVKIRNYYKDE